MNNRKQSYTIMGASLVVVLLVMTASIVTLATVATLDRDEVIECRAKNQSLSALIERKETKYKELKAIESSLENYQKAWAELIESGLSIENIKNRLNRLGAEHNIMISDVSNTEINGADISLKLRGAYLDLLECLNALEHELSLINCSSLAWEAEKGDILECAIDLEVFREDVKYES